MVNEISVLSKGLTFCPNNRIDKLTAIKDTHLYTRKLLLKSKFEKQKIDSEGCSTFCERQAFDNLDSLLEESEPKDLIDMIDLETLLEDIQSPPTNTPPLKSALKRASSLYPAPSTNHGVKTFLKMVSSEIQSLNQTSCDTAEGPDTDMLRST